LLLASDNLGVAQRGDEEQLSDEKKFGLTRGDEKGFQPTAPED